MNNPVTLTRTSVALTAPLDRVVLLAMVVGVYSTLALLKSRPPLDSIPDIPVGLDAALSFSMALLIAFRMNRAYERWWEARSLWGTLVNASRNLAIKLRRFARMSEGDCQEARDLIVAFSVGLKGHLRDDGQLSRLPGFENDTNEPVHIPGYVVSKLYELLQQLQSGEDAMGTAERLAIDTEARVLMNVCGGCEKIKTTPISTSWGTFTTQCIGIFLLTLPWGLVDDFGYWTVPISMVVAYVVIAAEVIARYVEQPFGLLEDHLDLESITAAIDRSVTSELLGERAAS